MTGAPPVLVIGTSDGIGRAVVLALLARGERVIGVSRRDAAIDDPRYEHHTRDVSTPQYAELLRAILGAHPGLAVAIHCAAVGSDFDPGDLAGELRCSPFYLARLFRAVEGTSIHRYRVRLRLARSLEALAGGRSIRAVAFDLGFASHSHFTAAFHLAFGITPSRFQRHASGRHLRELLGVASP